MFDITSKNEVRNNHLQETNNLLQEKLENSMSKLVAYEEELSAIRTSPASHGSGKTKDIEEISVTINEFQVIIDELRHKLHHKEEELSVEKEKYNRMLTDMTDTITANHALIDTLKSDLNRRPTQEEFVDLAMKLKTLQSVVYNADPDHEDRQIFTYAEALNYNNMLNIDHLVSNKLKVLENDLMETRRQLLALQEVEAVLRKEYNAACKENAESKLLISKLENDLHHMSSSGMTSTSSSDRHQTNDLVELLGGDEGVKSKAATSGSSASTGNTNDNMVNILQAQRDRYKEKLTQADNLVMSLQQKIESLTNEKQQLQSDNVVLYGKVKYVNSYSSYGMTPVKVQLDRMGALELGNGILNDDEHTRYVERKYEALYEQKLHPFTEFSEREKKRRTEDLQLLDRIILNTALNLLSTNMGNYNHYITYMGHNHLLTSYQVD